MPHRWHATNLLGKEGRVSFSLQQGNTPPISPAHAHIERTLDLDNSNPVTWVDLLCRIFHLCSSTCCHHIQQQSLGLGICSNYVQFIKRILHSPESIRRLGVESTTLWDQCACGRLTDYCLTLHLNWHSGKAFEIRRQLTIIELIDYSFGAALLFSSLTASLFLPCGTTTRLPRGTQKQPLGYLGVVA